jgi:late competence protein required for DNA uptake (superfamily II DNA/RNA helicase)
VAVSGIKRTAEDARFSKFIRERDNFTCQRCGKEHAPNSQGLHCAHNFTRRTKVTRHMMTNALALCYGCHQFVDSHSAEKEALFRLRFGNDEYERVAALAHGKRDRV